MFIYYVLLFFISLTKVVKIHLKLFKYQILFLVNSTNFYKIFIYSYVKLIVMLLRFDLLLESSSTFVGLCGA